MCVFLIAIVFIPFSFIIHWVNYCFLLVGHLKEDSEKKRFVRAALNEVEKGLLNLLEGKQI